MCVKLDGNLLREGGFTSRPTHEIQHIAVAALIHSYVIAIRHIALKLRYGISSAFWMGIIGREDKHIWSNVFDSKFRL